MVSDLGSVFTPYKLFLRSLYYLFGFFVLLLKVPLRFEDLLEVLARKLKNVLWAVPNYLL
jgi:hypothetical protein